MTPEEMKQIFNKAGEAGDYFITNKGSTRQLEALITQARAEAIEEFRAWLRSRDYADPDSEIDAFLESTAEIEKC